MRSMQQHTLCVSVILCVSLSTSLCAAFTPALATVGRVGPRGSRGPTRPTLRMQTMEPKPSMAGMASGGDDTVATPLHVIEDGLENMADAVASSMEQLGEAAAEPLLAIEARLENMTDAIADTMEEPLLAIEEGIANMTDAIADTMEEPLQKVEDGIQTLGEFTPSPVRKDPRLALLGIAALSGSGYGATHVLGGTLDPSSSLAIRIAASALVLAPFVRKCDRKDAAAAVETGSCLALAYIAQTLYLQNSKMAGGSAFLTALIAVVCSLVDVKSGKPLDERARTATTLTLLGAFALDFGGGARPLGDDVFGLLHLILFGAYLFKTESLLRRSPLQAIPITAVQTFVCAAVSIGWCALSHHIAAPGFSDILAAHGLDDHTIHHIFNAGRTPMDLERAQVLEAIKSAPQVLAHGPHATAELPVPVLSVDAMQAVDAMMQPVARASLSIEASSRLVPDGVLESRLELSQGVAKSLWNAKTWENAPKTMALICLGVVSSTAALALDSVAADKGKLTNSQSAVVSSTEPLWSALVGSLLISSKGTETGLHTVIGGLLVFAGCVNFVVSPRELVASGKLFLRQQRNTDQSPP